MKIIRNLKACYGCRACELACSFHHQGAFGPEKSAIRVDKDSHTGKIRLKIDSTCDDCKGEEQPLCVRYCSYRALSVSPGRSLT